MKFFGLTLITVAVIVLASDIYNAIYANYDYENRFSSFWVLADKASTIEQKSQYIDKFVAALEGGGFAGTYNAVFMDTPDNSFDQNFLALQSLQRRLHEIKQMDVKSFEYQTAIQQITAQEQGEAHQMLDVFEGIWWKGNHFWLWKWVGGLQVGGMIILLVVGGTLVALDD